MLIQNDATKDRVRRNRKDRVRRNSDLSGWDMIVPSGWAMPFWISLVYQGCRVAGVKEVSDNWLECMKMSGALDEPDTMAGKENDELARKQKEEKHLRRPPDKRRNYDKLGVKSPFCVPWLEYVKQWNRAFPLLQNKKSEENQFVPITEFYILRSTDALSFLSNLFSTEHSNSVELQ